MTSIRYVALVGDQNPTKFHELLMDRIETIQALHPKHPIEIQYQAVGTLFSALLIAREP